MSLSVHKSVHMCCQASHPFVGRACERIRQLQSWAQDWKATSFADLPFTGQPVWFQRELISFTLAWKNGRSMTQRLMMMMVTGNAPSQADTCFIHPRSHYVLMWLWITVWFPSMGNEGKLLLWGQKDGKSQTLSENPLCLPLFPLTLVWSRLIDIFLTGRDPGWESKVAAF